MNRNIIITGALAGVFLMMTSLDSSAQKISEQELKTNVTDISSATAKVMNLKAVTFQYDVKKYNNLKFPAGMQYGLLAEQVKPEFPELVNERAKSYSAGKNAFRVAKYDEVENAQLIPVLVAAIQEQQEQISLLKKELENLKESRKSDAD